MLEEESTDNVKTGSVITLGNNINSLTNTTGREFNSNEKAESDPAAGCSLLSF